MAADPDEFVPDLDCVDGDCSVTNLFALATSFKPGVMSTSVLMAGRAPASTVIGS